MRKGFTVWFTGLPSSGKTTLARLLEPVVKQRGFQLNVFDGDEVRMHLSKGLGYSKEDRDENIRRIAYVSGLVTQHGGVAIACAISPYQQLREEARKRIGQFVEVFVHCPVGKCIERDVKGLYKKALNGEIDHFTGVSDPYEEPADAEVIVHTHLESPEESLAKIVRRLEEMGYLPPAGFRGLTSVSIPTYVIQGLEGQLIADTSMDVSRYVTQVLTQTLDEPAATPLAGEQREKIIGRLKELGYVN
jgi:adenylylsulfate kinase